MLMRGVIGEEYSEEFEVKFSVHQVSVLSPSSHALHHCA